MSNEKVLIPEHICAVDYFNIIGVEIAFELILQNKNAIRISPNTISMFKNKGDELKEMIVFSEGVFNINYSVDLPLVKNEKYSPFRILQTIKFKNSFSRAENYVKLKYMDYTFPYIRVGTKYYKKTNIIDRYGVLRSELTLWDKMTILEDYPPNVLDDVEKFDNFTIVPDNKSHSPVINNNYNMYSQFEHEPCDEIDYDPELGCYWTKTLIEHIFGDQHELGFKYLKILYDHPKQQLPILVLISEERSTGKTTFVDFLNILFGANMVIINPQDIANQFNGAYGDKNIIAIEESRFESTQATEKLKNLATQKEILINSKNIRQFSIPFYGKLIITSNDETRFSKVDTSEIRYWVRKVPSLKGKANHQILQALKDEIPQFLYFLNTMDAIDFTKSRMVFTEEQIATTELKTVKKESRTGLCKDLEMHLEQFCIDNQGVKEFKFTALHIKDKFFSRTEKYEVNFINKTLKDEMKLTRDKMQRFIPLEEDKSIHQGKVSGTPFILINKYYKYEEQQQGKTITKRIPGKTEEGAIGEEGYDN